MKSLFLAFIVVLFLAFDVSFAAQQQKKISLKGKAEVIHIDRNGDKSEFKYFIKHNNGRHELKFKKVPNNLLTDADIEIDGLESLDGTSIDVNVIELTQVLPNTFGAQKTIVILVNFSDNTTQFYTVDFAKDVFNQVSGFDRENSFQQTWLTDAANQPNTVDVYGWFTLATTAAACDYNVIATQGDAAVMALGINLAQYRHRVYAFAYGNCGWWGLGTVGGNPSRAWIDGNLELAVVGHEMGHNFGLQHSHSLCAPGCSLNEYGDPWDIMGNARGGGHFHAYQKERLGWLNYGSSPPITTVITNGQYRIGAYETNIQEPKALKIFKGVNSYGERLSYYIEYRAQLGYDAIKLLQKAVIVHVGNESNGYDNNLWDLDQTTSVTDWVLDVGQVYSDTIANISFSLASWNSTEAFIDIVVNPIITLPSPSNLVIQ